MIDESMSGMLPNREAPLAAEQVGEVRDVRGMKPLLQTETHHISLGGRCSLPSVGLTGQ